VDGRIILKWIFKNRMICHGLDSTGSGQGAIAGCCGYNNDLSGSTRIA
jgi:hypothetical protein